MFIARTDTQAISLKKRKFVYVLPEVIELIDRITSRFNNEITVKDAAFELCVHPMVIGSIFKYLTGTGLLCKDEVSNTYSITRPVNEKDYGTITNNTLIPKYIGAIE